MDDMVVERAVADGDGRMMVKDKRDASGLVAGSRCCAPPRSPGKRAAIAAGLMFVGAPVLAQQPPSLPQGSLVVDPQQGATPRPLVPTPLPSTPVGPPAVAPSTTIATDTPSSIAISPQPSAPVRGGLPLGPAPVSSDDPQEAPSGGLPAPGGDPLAIDPASDPVLRLARTQTQFATFREAIAAAVSRNPALDESVAQVDEAEAARQEAKARALPVADLSVSTFQVIDRAFSNDPNIVLERSRPRNRTDGLVRVQQPIVDFGSSVARIRAGQARLEAARSSVEDTGTRLALQAVSAWYTVYGYRVLVELGEAFGARQRGLRGSVDERIRQGAAAAGDIAQVDSYIASSGAQLADFRRRLAGAEAQYVAVVGMAPPPELARAPAPSLAGVARASLESDTDSLPIVRAARFGATAARDDVRALKSDRLPQLSAAVDAGRYGIIENDRDYDIRGSLTLSMRLGGGAKQRVDQAQARAEGADARLRRTQVEARRDAEIAWADVAALEEAQAAIEHNYLASRRSRDVLAERFRVSRGTLFDLLAADSNYFGVAARFVQTMIELDTARYALLARTGRLLPTLDIQPAALENR